MKEFLKNLQLYEKKIREIREIIITNILLIGQIPSPTFHEIRRAEFFMDRLAEFHVDESSMDGYGNSIGIIRGKSKNKLPIFLVAHLDTFLEYDFVHDLMVTEKFIKGPGVADNSAGVGVLLSLPEIFKQLNIEFESDLVLVGTIESIGKGNLRGIRRLLQSWPTPIRGGICLEGVELGMLSHYSDGMIRGEIKCSVFAQDGFDHLHKPNAIIMLNEVINQIMELRLPQKPRTQIVIGIISGGFNHGKIAHEAKIGFEIRSDSDKMVREIYSDIRDIVEGMNKEFEITLKLDRISNLNAARLSYKHPLVKYTNMVMKRLNVNPVREPSESAQSIFLHRGIPAITLGLTYGKNFRQEDAMVEIDPMFKGIAQVIGVLKAIDSGVCDE
jgi:tripeptide aminopeptidase